MPAKETAARRRCAVYVRISKDVRDQAGVQRQERECRALAESRGWDVTVVYSDNDLEASSGKPRPGYLAMLDDMRADRIDAVVGWHSDRIVRRPDELEELIKLADAHDVMFAAVQVGNIDLATASGRLVARLLGAAAKYETELKGERQSAQLKDRAHKGLHTGGGTRPYGYEPGYAGLRADEAAIVREIADRVLAGQTVNAVTNWLVDEGVTTVRGGPWHAGVVRRMLLNPRLAGLAVWEGEIVGEAQWPGIVTADEHRALVALLTSKGNQRPARARVALLRGLIWCGRCDYELVTFVQQRPGADPKHVRCYGCRTFTIPGKPGFRKSCGRMSIKAQWVEDDVAERLLARLARPLNAQRLERATDATRRPDDGVADQLADLEERLRDLGRDYADQVIGRTEFIAARDRIAARIREVESKVAAPRIRVPLGDVAALAAWWENADLDRRAALVRQYVDRVVVQANTGRRSDYNPARVEVSWR